MTYKNYPDGIGITGCENACPSDLIVPEMINGKAVWSESPLAYATQYVDDFLFRHPDFKDAAYSATWGILQLLDSAIIEYTINKATEHNIPVLPVHDEVVIPQQYKGHVGGFMIDGFHSVTKNRFKNHVPQIAWTTEV